MESHMCITNPIFHSVNMWKIHVSSINVGGHICVADG